MRNLRVAVVGAGVMGRYHANNYAALRGVDLVAVADPEPLRRAEALSSFDCRAYRTVDELLASESIDAASVAVPTSLHFAVTKRLLEAGVHVLVEKPVATEVAQAKELAALSRDLGLVLQVGHITRFYRAVQLLGERVREPYLIEARRTVPYARIKDVGVVLDLMIHDLDIVLRMIPGDPVELSVVGRALNGTPLEDVAAAQITFAGGCIARFLASRVAPDAERSLVISEPHQTMRLDFAKEPYTEIAIYKRPDADSDTGHVQLDRHVVHEDNPLRSELEHFLARIRSDAPPIGTLDDDLRSLALATRLLTSIERERAAVLA
ncbi:MAG TPA: Gfo/Idh/MocA family oxidoreductase [Trueperaceae bacterium]|nr:Gfo/Idh/MocA family oxidoreductase [Trueperaceae bacterium]